MATHGARRLFDMADNLGRIIGIELMTAAQGVEYRAPLTTSPPLARAMARLREDVATLGNDRYLAPDIEKANSLIRSGALIDAAHTDDLPKLELEI